MRLALTSPLRPTSLPSSDTGTHETSQAGTFASSWLYWWGGIEPRGAVGYQLAAESATGSLAHPRDVSILLNIPR
jgi:hypothetical protein